MIKKKQYSERQIVVFSVIDVYHGILLFIVATEYEFQIMVKFSHSSLTRNYPDVTMKHVYSGKHGDANRPFTSRCV